MATRWRSPPDRVAGLRSMIGGEAEKFYDGREFHSTVLEPIEQILPYRDVRQEKRVLKHVANPALVDRQIYPSLAVIERFAVDADKARSRPVKTSDKVQQAGFSCTGRAEKGGDASAKI